MPRCQLRSALRDHVSQSHARLDAAVGRFADRQGYADYLEDTHLFRSAVESRLRDLEAWPVAPLAALVRADMADLGRVPRSPLPFDGLCDTEAHGIGAAYVLEGSALGARLLVDRAAALGFGIGADFGARHLAAQCRDRHRWPAFLTVLGAVPPDRHDAVLDGAGQTFAFALSVYAGALA